MIYTHTLLTVLVIMAGWIIRGQYKIMADLTTLQTEVARNTTDCLHLEVVVFWISGNLF